MSYNQEGQWTQLRTGETVARRFSSQGNGMGEEARGSRFSEPSHEHPNIDM